MTMKVRLYSDRVDRSYKTTMDNLLILLCIFKKWNPIALGCYEDEGSVDCLLCSYYAMHNCVLCPVFKKTKQKGCLFTPYTKFNGAKSPEKYDHIEEEIEFLISLLDEETQEDLENIFIEWCKNGDE